MPAELIDGRAIAKKIRADVAERAKKLAQGGLRPGLAVVMVGDNPASAVYTADSAEECAFIVPARVQRAGVHIAISTGGENPRLSAELRKRLEEVLD